jgi:hypothetical protein
MNAAAESVQITMANVWHVLRTAIHHVLQEATAAVEYVTHRQKNVRNALTLISRLVQVQQTAVINLRHVLQENAVIRSDLTVP